MYHASITYKSDAGNETYITFCGIPGTLADGHAEYFVKQLCLKNDWIYVSSQPEYNPRRHLTAQEKASGLIRKPIEFFERNRKF